MKRGIVAILFMFVGIVLSSTKHITASTEASLASKVTDNNTTETDSYMIDFYPWNGNYDYDFYLRGIYLSADGKEDQLYIQPIDFISSEEVEKLEEYGVDLEKEGGSYHIEEFTDETISLPLKPDTQFHIINWQNNPEMANQSLNHPDPELTCICALDDPFAFFQFMSDDYGEHLASYPLCLYLDENGYIDTVIELCLP